MKKVVFALSLVAVTALSTNAQVQKSFQKTFNLNGAKVVLIDLKNAKVEIKRHSKEVMEVQTDVNLKNGNDALISQLSGQGRYDLNLGAERPEATLTGGSRPTIKVSGADLDEQITYTISVPDYIDAQNVNSIAYGRRKAKKAGASVKKTTKKSAKKPAKKAVKAKEEVTTK